MKIFPDYSYIQLVKLRTFTKTEYEDLFLIPLTQKRKGKIHSYNRTVIQWNEFSFKLWLMSLSTLRL